MTGQSPITRKERYNFYENGRACVLKKKVYVEIPLRKRGAKLEAAEKKWCQFPEKREVQKQLDLT